MSISSRLLKSYENNLKSSIVSSPIYKKKIIIVDDVPIFRDTYKKAFESVLTKYKIENCECVTYNDGIYILQTVIEDQESKLISLIVSDDQMKFIDGKDAFEGLLSLMDSNKIDSIPYSICVTADTDDHNVHKLLSLGFSKVMNKNLALKEIEAILKEVNII